MMSSKNNGFTTGDIERYHSGQMSLAERHALEKAALDDPFLADALEGYAFTSTAQDDLSKIQSRLDRKLNQKKVVPLFQKYKWLSAAAIFIVIASGGWLAYNLSNGTKENSVAVQEKEIPKVQQQSIPNTNPLADSQALKASAPLANEQIQKSKASNNTKTTEPAASLINEQSNEETITNTNNIETSKPTAQLPRLRTKKLPAPLNESSNANNNLVKMQSIEVRRNNTDTFQFNSGYLSGVTKQSPSFKDSNAPISVRGVAPADSVTNLNIVLTPLPMDSAQVVVIARGAETKVKEKYPKVTIDTLEPAEGYVNFDDYVANNLKVPEELKTKTVSGDVQLSFDVDKNGQPTNIAVVKSLCQKCDEEAIRILKEGPKWKKNKNKKGKITIKF